MKTYYNNFNSVKMDDETAKSDWTSREWVRSKDNEMYLAVKKTLDNGYNISKERIKDADNDTLLIAASFMGFTDTTRLLLTVPDIDLGTKNNKGETALDVAKNEDIRKLLLDAKKGIFPTILRKGTQKT